MISAFIIHNNKILQVNVIIFEIFPSNGETGPALPYRQNGQPPRVAKFRGRQCRVKIFIYITRNRWKKNI